MEQRLQDDARREGSRDVRRPQHRKPYRSPRLVSYGDFHRLTRASGGTNAVEDVAGGSGTKNT